MKTNLQALKGFRDFLPREKRERDFVEQKFKETFELFGFAPLETPTLEYRETIMGKYGDEADKLVFQFTDNGGREVAMRYDQTVPTARVMAQYQNELALPFRRYQIQNVFRADKPQKGRYREFTQCDIDILGSKDLLADAETLAVMYSALKNIGFVEVTLKVNDRALLTQTVRPFATENFSEMSIIITIDKLDKIGVDGVVAELIERGLEPSQAEKLMATLQSLQPNESIARIFEFAQNLGVPQSALEFSPTLARGLDYYTGMIAEIVSAQYPVGSLAGVGRYDNLIRDLSGVDMPATGGSFGFDRVVEAARELGLLPKDAAASRVLVTIFDSELARDSARIAKNLREAGVATELYADSKDLSKQMKYAAKTGIPFVIIMGSDEKAQNKMLLRNMTDGTQELLSLSEVIDRLLL